MGTLRDLQNEMHKLEDALDAVRNDPRFGALLNVTREGVLSVRPDPDDDDEDDNPQGGQKASHFK